MSVRSVQEGVAIVNTIAPAQLGSFASRIVTKLHLAVRALVHSLIH